MSSLSVKINNHRVRGWASHLQRLVYTEIPISGASPQSLKPLTRLFNPSEAHSLTGILCTMHVLRYSPGITRIPETVCSTELQEEFSSSWLPRVMPFCLLSPANWSHCSSPNIQASASLSESLPLCVQVWCIQQTVSKCQAPSSMALVWNALSRYLHVRNIWSGFYQ